METGFVKGASDNLPGVVNKEMIVAFFVDNADHVSAEIQGVKATTSSRKDYSDTAIGYVQLKREGKVCIIKCKVTPEHKIRNKEYSVTVKIDEEEEKILDSTCNDCAASSGGCKHSIAVIFWLYNKSQEPSVTSKECYWKAPKLSKVVKEKQFVKLPELVKVPVPIPTPSGTFKQLCLERGCATQAKGMIFMMNMFDPIVESMSLHHLSIKYLQSIGSNAATAEEFFTFCKETITEELCRKAEVESRDQSKSVIWKELRYGRITASRAYECSRCKTYEGSLIEIIMGAGLPLKMKAVTRGSNLEKDVLQVVSGKLNMAIQKCGIFMKKDYPIFGASPDGISYENECCFEVKCPSSEATIKNYVRDGKIVKKYHAQMQLQMFFSNCRTCYFCVASPQFENNNDVDIHEVIFNEKYTQKLISECTKFWVDAVFKKLIFNK